MKVLLIDDEPDIRKVAALSLTRVGMFDTLVASSAPQGLEMLKEQLPDVVLLDMMMPGMDGLTALEELRKIPGAQTIPVVFMTAKLQAAEVQSYRERGAAGVIYKPFDPMTLPAELKKILAETDTPAD